MFPTDLKGMPSQYLYYLTVHEMAHTVHFDRILNLWGSYSTHPMESCYSRCVEDGLRESWGVGVGVGLANQITRTHYKDFYQSTTNPIKALTQALLMT